jgi:hypothetical protein
MDATVNRHSHLTSLDGLDNRTIADIFFFIDASSWL